MAPSMSSASMTSNVFSLQKLTRTSLQSPQKVRDESNSSNLPFPFNSMCSLSVLWNPLRISKPSGGEKNTVRNSLQPPPPMHPTLTLGFRQNKISYTGSTFETISSSPLLPFNSACPILHTTKPQPQEEETRRTTARQQHQQLLMYSDSENWTITLTNP